MSKVSRNSPILTVSVAAELAGMHAQTVRQYDRIGLVVAKRTKGGGRRYSLNDVDRLIEVQRMSAEDGINLAGISRILELQTEVEKLTRRISRLERDLNKSQVLAEYMAEELSTRRKVENRVFAAGPKGDITMAEGLEMLRQAIRDEASTELVRWNPRALLELESLSDDDLDDDDIADEEFDEEFDEGVARFDEELDEDDVVDVTELSS